jgi:hypothetical protein
MMNYNLNNFEIIRVTITKIPSYINRFQWNIVTGIMNTLIVKVTWHNQT